MRRDTQKLCHKNAPEKLVSLFIECDKKYHLLADKVNVNVRYVYDLLHYGKLPTNKTSKGRKAREKLFIDKKKIDKPDYIKIWDHLPREERHQVIKEYLKWKNKI